ncbi:MAG: sigma-70 family RNA polymerase sigma factor [Actinomycetota bacterium]|nr:sigma-70 family RNA polymerase sigma factor [Actinomycetota bacterium]
MGRSETADDAAAVGSGRGDAEFTAFYRRELLGQVRRAALLVGSEAVANDLVHDAFVALYERWTGIDEPGPYLNRAVLNRCRDLGRRRTRRDGALERLGPEAPAPEHDVLWDVLDTLPFNQRAAVILRFYAQMTEREIADALGCATGSVGPWITRALAAMREELS